MCGTFLNAKGTGASGEFTPDELFIDPAALSDRIYGFRVVFPDIWAMATVAMPMRARAEIQFEPTMESLRQYQITEWYRDAKFGVYMHWGPSS